MTTDDSETEMDEAFSIAVERFWENCCSDELSLDMVREGIASLPKVSEEKFNDTLRHHSFLHQVCSNKAVSLEIVEEILKFYPDAAKFVDVADGNTKEGEWDEVGTSYPLHAACWNESCPLSVIELLMTKYPAALRHLGIFEDGLRISNDDFTKLYWAAGTPLSYYLERETNLTLEGVELLVGACPEALRISDVKKQLTPLHTLVLNRTLSEHLDVVQYLVRSNPSLLRAVDSYDADEYPELRGIGNLPIHLACREGKISLDVVRFLVESWPESINQRESDFCLPLHCICQNKELDDSTAIDVLRYLVQIDPTKVNMGHSQGSKPIHFAAGEGRRSRAFCEYLVAQNAELVRARDHMNHLPLHEACKAGRLETVGYFYEMYPEAVDFSSGRGFFPIHETMFNRFQRSEIIEYLMSLDPDCLSKRVVRTDGRSHRFDGNLPLHMMMDLWWQCPRLEAGMKFLFDAYPEAILARNDAGLGPLDIAAQSKHDPSPECLAFLTNQLEYALKATTRRRHEYALRSREGDGLATPDKDGRLLLHRAIMDKDASLGSIKLLVKGNPVAMQAKDNKGLLPAHLACRRISADVMKYLIEMDQSALDVCDAAGDSLLHHACRPGNTDAVKVLLDELPSLVALENDSGVLPIHLMCLKSGKDDTTLVSVEYTEAIWRLLLATPAIVPSATTDGSTSVGKSNTGKRKRRSPRLS